MYSHEQQAQHSHWKMDNGKERPAAIVNPDQKDRECKAGVTPFQRVTQFGVNPKHDTHVRSSLIMSQEHSSVRLYISGLRVAIISLTAMSAHWPCEGRTQSRALGNVRWPYNFAIVPD